MAWKAFCHKSAVMRGLDPRIHVATPPLKLQIRTNFRPIVAVSRRG